MATEGYIFNIKKYAVHDGPGIRTTLFLQGCPLNCRWCHNPESQPLSDGPSVDHSFNCLKPYYRNIPYQSARRVTVSEMMAELRKDLVFFDESGGGVTLSGGEPLLQLDFVRQLSEQCRRENIHVTLDTSGYASWNAYEKILPFINLILFDLKLMDDSEHQKYTGVSNALILENLHNLLIIGHPLIVRVPLIPDITDTGVNLKQIAEYLQKFTPVPEIQLLPYNPMGIEKYNKLNRGQNLANLKTQSLEQLEKIRYFFSDSGLNAKIGG